MAAREHREIQNVEQTKKMVPFVTCETLFGQHVSELAFGVNKFDLDLRFQVDSVEQPTNQAQVRHLPIMIILITAALSSKMYT